MVIAAKVDKADQEYYEDRVKPLLNDPLIEYIGEVGDEEKGALLGDAIALLFPIDWPEPFGLVQIEAMACGTPVIAFRRGAVPEITEPGATGCLIDNIDEAVAAIPMVQRLDRRSIRRHFEKRFVVERMAHDYLELYRKVMSRGLGAEQKPRTAAGADTD